jgi:hypothetical protein
MKNYKVFVISFFIMLLVMPNFIIACSENGNVDNGGGIEYTTGNVDAGNEKTKGAETPVIHGEIIGILTYEMVTKYGPVDNLPYYLTELGDYSLGIEDEDGHIYFLTATGVESSFEYSGSGPLSEVTTTIAGYIYTDNTPFDDEVREVGGKTRVISHTGIQAAVTGTFETLTGYYMSGESIRIETIEESS